MSSCKCFAALCIDHLIAQFGFAHFASTQTLVTSPLISHFSAASKVFPPASLLQSHLDMCQVSSSSNSRRNDVVIAARGFLLGASAVAACFVLEDLISKGDSAASLRGGSNTPTTTTEPTLQGSSSNAEQEIRGINLPDINILVPEASNDGISLLPAQSYVPTVSPSTPIPTYMPTATGEIPTDMPTQFDNEVISSSSSLVKLRSNSNEVGFRLKLYWETGYYWQEMTTEKFWCMACPSGGGGECKRNDKMELRDCKKKSNEDAQFVATSAGKGHQLRITDTNLCLQKNSRGRAIKLKPCNTKNELQQFVGFKSDGKKFDLMPSTSNKRCLSQHHHPKSGEIIYAETCVKAHRVDTGYWVAY